MQLQPVASTHVRAGLPALPPQASPYLFTQGNKRHVRRTGPLFPAASCPSPAAAAATPPVLHPRHLAKLRPRGRHNGDAPAYPDLFAMWTRRVHQQRQADEITESHARRAGGHARGLGARHAERRGNLPTDLAVAAAGVCNVRYAAHFRFSVDMTLWSRKCHREMNGGIGPYTFARASSHGRCISPKCGVPYHSTASCSLHRHSRIEHHMDEVPALPQEDWITLSGPPRQSR